MIWRSEDEGVTDGKLARGRFMTPMGLAEATADGLGVRTLCFVDEAQKEIIAPQVPLGPSDLVPTVSALPSHVPGHEHLRRLEKEVMAYCQGQLPTFETPLSPRVLQEGTPFQRAVWKALQAIGYGETLTYKALASRVGVPRGYRAVGAACGRNRVMILIPCHRCVISAPRPSQNSVGGYAGGSWRKKWLLDRESRPGPGQGI